MAFDVALTVPERALLEAMQLEMRELLASEAVFALDLDPVTALQVAGLLQLCLRHPQLPESNAAAATEILALLSNFFTPYPAIRELLRRGADPACDVAADERPRIIVP